MQLDAIPQYDMCVKRLLAEKNIIANILVNAVDVYKGMRRRMWCRILKENPISVWCRWSRG